MELAPLTVLNKTYTIKRTLGEPSPFDIRYLGQDVDSEQQYVIREFFPSHLVRREAEKTSVEVKGGDEEADLFASGLEYFQKESDVLAGLHHEALPSSYDVFEANGTFYRVRPHLPSMSLAKGLEDKGQLSEKATLTIMIPILEALQEAHENGLYHGGVSPQTIRLLEDGKVLLTGFRGAFIQLARESGNLSELVQPGTSAVEQYTPRGNQGPWTDVYGAAATICKMVTGHSLPEATDRLEGEDPLSNLLEDAEVFSSPGVREALFDALEVDPSKRLQSAEALVEALIESSTRYEEGEASYSIIPVEPESEEEEEPLDDDVEVLSTTGRAEDRPARAGAEASDTSSSGKTALMIGVPLLVLALGGGTAWFFLNAGETSTASSGSYDEYRSQADSLFEQEEYDEAEFYYNEALRVREDDEYVEQRLNRLAQMQEEGSQLQYERQLERGNELKAQADSVYDVGNTGEANRLYSRALAAYYGALEANQDGEEAQQMVNEVEQRQESIARAQVEDEGDGSEISLDQLANFFQEQGDRQLQAGNLQAALDKYRQALEYRPEDASLQRAITDLEQEIQAQARERQFQEHYNRGQRFLREEDYQEALAAFDEAAQVQPNDPRLEEARARADSLLEEQQRREAEYKAYRSQGDSALEEGSFEEAIATYEQALEVRPDDEYVQDRLEEARRELEEVRLAQQEQQRQEERRQEIIDEEGVYTVVDQEPQVRGGLASLTQSAQYPESAQRQGVEGRVYIQAIVNADGTVREAEVIRGPGAGTGDEALRVVRNAEFIPAEYNGEPVPASTTVWVHFQLQD